MVVQSQLRLGRSSMFTGSLPERVFKHLLASFWLSLETDGSFDGPPCGRPSTAALYVLSYSCPPLFTLPITKSLVTGTATGGWLRFLLFELETHWGLIGCPFQGFGFQLIRLSHRRWERVIHYSVAAWRSARALQTPSISMHSADILFLPGLFHYHSYNGPSR